MKEKKRAESGIKNEKKREANKEFARVTYAFVGLFLALMGYIVYFSAVESKKLINSPYNPRLDSMADRVVRGMILDRKGKELAKTRITREGEEVREYPYGNLFAHAAGYSVKGKAGLESAANFELLTSHAFFLEKLTKEFQGEKNRGDNVVTTLDAGLQQAAYNALGDNKGAVVILEPDTGKILSMVSKPDFNPNLIEESWEGLNADEESPLLNRATQGQYAPGSTFKLVTALEYMRENKDYDGYSYVCAGEISHEGTTISCANHTAHGEVNLAQSFAYSCNSSFCNIGLSLDIPKYRETAAELLFNGKLPCELPCSKSKFRLKKADSSADKMMTAMGQGKTQVSPYHMALLTAAIANGGILMKPYFISEITNYKGASVKKYRPQKYKELMTSGEAMRLKSYMQDVVSYGTGSVLGGGEYTAAGKTGTAEYSSDLRKNHSWFVGFSNVDNPDIVLSVIVEQSDGNTKAVEVAKQIFDSYYYN